MDRQTTTLELPLFPLRTVLFPGMTLPLHIFEERYKLMIGHCLERQRMFGVVLLRSGGTVGGQAVPYEVGTVARITHCVPMADGRFNLLTQGTIRFQILSSGYQDGYLTGQVELLDEEELDPRQLAEQREIVRRRFSRFIAELVAITRMKSEPIDFPADPTALSYFVATHLPLDPWEKQRLLEASSTDVRLAEERRIIGRERDLLRRFGTAEPPYPTGDDAHGRLRLSPN